MTERRNSDSLWPLNVKEQVRGRLNKTGAARRDAIERARGELPSYSDEDVEEITGKFAALSATAAANAVADALTERCEPSLPDKPLEGSDLDVSAGSVRVRIRDVAKVSAAVAGIGTALAALVHWLRGLWH